MQLEVTADVLTFPILSISRRGEIEVVQDPAVLQTTNSLALKRGYYDGMVVIDTHGAGYVVVQVLSQRPIGRLWGFRFLKPRRLLVSLVFKPSRQYTISELRELLVRNIRRLPGPWLGFGELSEVEERLRRAETVEEIFAAVTTDSSETRPTD